MSYQAAWDKHGLGAGGAFGGKPTCGLFSGGWQVAGPLLLLIGCCFTGLAVVIFRREANERRQYWGAVRVNGEVVEVRAGEPETARILYRYEGQEFVLWRREGWNSEYNDWDSTGHQVGEQVPLMVPPHHPQNATLVREVEDLYFGPAPFAVLGFFALGLGLLFVTESLMIAGPVIAVACVGGLALPVYCFFTERSRNAGRAR